MRHLLKLLLFLCIFMLYANNVKATHAMGGGITWSCLGNGQYVFELKFYRDCNGFDVNVNHEELEVWGHPTLSKIEVKYVERKDISPNCTAAGGITPFLCGTGISGGNGAGAIEEVIYRSNPTTISGTIPSSGLHFTFQHFSRSGQLTNIQTPTSYGITITASMFPIPGNTGGCIDNSPQFLETPYMVSCAGNSFEYNPNAVDPDLDSLVIKWGKPLNHFPNGTYSPPTNPAPLPFVSGYSYTNSTPDNNFNANNEAITLDPQTGIIKFKSFNPGNFMAKLIVESYRNKVKIASVEREFQFVIENCSGINNPPQITPPFGANLFEKEFYAGDLVQFNILAQDNDLLQNNSPQSVTISSSGLMYGDNFTDPNNGCENAPCATLNKTLPTIGVQNSNLAFNWQTTCDHLVDASGNAQKEKTHIFVFKIQDDYCPIPNIKYATVKIKLKNKDVLPAPQLKCISYANNGDLHIEWQTITDPFGTFKGYEIRDTEGNIYGVQNDINTGFFNIPNGVNSPKKFYVNTLSGCGGKTATSSDTLSPIFLDLDNPNDGRAKLSWTQPLFKVPENFKGSFQIYKEYPAGTWTLINSVPYSTTLYYDTISVCREHINYKIALSDFTCPFTSNTNGDIFADRIVPNIPIITNVGFDTLTGKVNIQWDINSQKDTYGYVIYQTDNSGNIAPIDTVWGRTNTFYTHEVDIADKTFEYSVAAFDSCYTTNVPPTYQTSAKANPHTTSFLSGSVDFCSRTLQLNWTGYVGFEKIEKHVIYGMTNNSNWEKKGETTNNYFSLDILPGDEIFVTVETISKNGASSFSNIDTLLYEGDKAPSMSYLSVATVDNNEVIIKYKVSPNEMVQSVILERYNDKKGVFEFLEEKEVTHSDEIIFRDEDAEINRKSYLYRAKIMDTCYQIIGYSNEGKTIFLNVITDQATETNLLQWTPYHEFLGNIKYYQIYRSIGDNYPDEFVANLPRNLRSYEDVLTDLPPNFNGKVCYRIEAKEGSNAFSIEGESSFSNISCGIFEPSIFIPNAFTVGGKNPVFKPYTKNRMVTDYLFEIYDRYGRVVFSTNDPEEGWSGQLTGQTRTAEEGVYVYRLSLKDGNDIEIIKYGHVSLLDYRKVK